MTLFLLFWFIWSISMLKTDFKPKSTNLLMVPFSLYVYSVGQIWFTTSNLSLRGYSEKPHHDLLPVSMKYQWCDFIYAVCAYSWGRYMISKQCVKEMHISLFIYYNNLKYPHCSSVLYLLKIICKTFTNVFVPQVALVSIILDPLCFLFFGG